MKAVTILLVLFPFSLAGLAQPERRFFPEENNPDFKRYIYIENEKGEFEMIDLKADEDTYVEPKVSTSDVEFDLYTINNRNSPFVIRNSNVNSLASSNFNPRKPSLFVAHGWNNNRNSAVNTNIRNAIFSGGYDYNVFIIDWSGPANQGYLSAKGSVVGVGQVIGNFINSIQSAYGLTGSSFVLTGHSLGAHVVGSAGATVRSKVANIIGLDPAGPLFTVNNINERIDPSDGNIVQIIHTNGNLLGFASSIGDIDYYPNGGMTQPGCGWDLAGTCAHSRAYLYLAEALNRGAVFRGTLCSDYNTFLNGRCSSNTKSTMGELSVTTRTLGDYFLETNTNQPFGRG